MSNGIINKRENAPANVGPLLGIGFVPAEHPDIIYIPGYYNVQGLAKISYYICLLLTYIFGFVFLYTTISETVKWVKYSEFRSEGVLITFIMFGLIFILFLICRRYFIKSKKLQKQIENGEVRLGLWITPIYIISNDLNEGFRCVEKKEIESLSIYKGGRFPVDMVILHLKNKQEMRVAASWLPAYYKKVEALKTLIESNLNSAKNKFAIFDEFIESNTIAGDRYGRFFQLCVFTKKHDAKNKLNRAEKKELIAYINQKIADWLPGERVADENWWVDIETIENWEYGVNGVQSFGEFKGYLKTPHWLMPLAKTAILEFEKADLIAKHNVTSFIDADCYAELENLSILIMISDYGLEQMMACGKFNHLKKLHTPSVNFFRKELKTEFEEWKKRCGIE